MKNLDILTKSLAMTGTVLAWLPILAPILISVLLEFQEGIFRFDYLMPAELFPSSLIGGGLLIWGAIRARSRLKLIAWSLGVAVFLLVGGQGFAVITGMATSTAEPPTWQLVIAIGSLVAYSLVMVAMAIGGILLLRDVFRRSQAM